MVDRMTLRFVKAVNAYNVDDVATFNLQDAEKLIKWGKAVEFKKGTPIPVKKRAIESMIRK